MVALVRAGQRDAGRDVVTLVSVIIPTHDRPQLLMGRAIPSVYAQTVTDWELLVVGDGTDRETCAAMADLASRDARVRFWDLPRQQYPSDPVARWRVLGLEALNHGLDSASGEWVAVLGDDDEFAPDHHEALLAVAAETGADHAYGMSDTLKGGVATGQVYGAWPPGPGQLCDGAALWRRSLGYRYDPGCQARGLPEDADLWARMAADGVRSCFVPRIVHHYHRNWP